MLNLTDKKIVFAAELCRQCGSCLAACPHSALSAKMGSRQYQIICNQSKCVGCGLCVNVCQTAYQTGRKPCQMSDVTGAHEIFLAWHRDAETRKFAASGGITRAIIRDGLQQRQFDAVYCLTYQTDGEPAGGYLTSYPADEAVMPRSLYRPVMWGANLGLLNPAWRRILLVGLPCQIRSARVFLQRRAPHFEIRAVTIFCKKQKEFGYSRYIACELGASSREWSRVIYRGNGWPGTMQLRDSSAPPISFLYPALCWNLPGCRGCFDCLNSANSDLTVADPWDIVPAAPEEPGQNLVMAWSETGSRWLHSFSNLVLGATVTPEDAAKSLPMTMVIQKQSTWQAPPLLSRAMLMRLIQQLKRAFGEFYLPYRRQLRAGRQRGRK